MVILQVRHLANFGEEGDSFGVCGIPLQPSDDAQVNEGDVYKFSARLVCGSLAVGLLKGKLTIG